MNTDNRRWLFIGAVLIVGVSALFFTVRFMNPFVPMPLYLVVLAWILSYGFIVVMPFLYVIEVIFLSNKEFFGKFVLTASLLFLILNIWYFFNSWDYGIKYQGELHTKIVAVENLVGFLLLILLAFIGFKNQSKTVQHSANLLLFLLLSWCAFPYLGETP